MPAPKLDIFLTDPKHKEERDFLSGVIDARVKEIAEQYEIEKKKKKKRAGEQDDDDNDENGSFFDKLFGGNRE